MKTRRQFNIYLISIRLSVVVGLVTVATPWASAAENGTQPPAPAIATLQSSYGKLPLSFEANQGQWDPAVQFVTRGGRHTLFLTPSEAILTLRTSEAKTDRRADHTAQHKPLSSPSKVSQSVVRMTFAGADPQAEVVGLEPLPGIVNYFIGDDPLKWHTNIPTYQRVQYKNLYAGIDLIYYGNQGQLEYDLVVAPGADPAQIRLAFDGIEQIAVDDQGDLVLTLPQSSMETAEGAAPMLRLHKPVVYQKDEQGEKHLLASAYVLRSTETTASHPTAAVHPRETSQVAFQIASYDESKPLIIDPVLSWTTYLGGSRGDGGLGVAVDAAGNAYVTGSTSSSDFPGTRDSPIQSTYTGVSDVFVTKVNATGPAILYSTYLGGSEEDVGFGIAVDKVGQTYVTGYTFGPGDSPEFPHADFPGTAGSPIQSAFGGGRADAFVVKLNATGTALIYSTYLGGHSSLEFGNGIAVDTAGNAYVTGQTESSGFPGTAGSLIQGTYAGLSDAFVTKVNATGTALVYSTYLGTRGPDFGKGIAVDAAGNAYVTGSTSSSDFPGTRNSPIQSTLHGSGNVFVTKIDAAGTAIVYSTYLGGSGSEFIGDDASGIAVDIAGNAYVTGGTSSSDFPGTKGSRIQSTLSGNTDAFVTKINEAGTALLYSTYLGGSGSDGCDGIAVDAAGNAYVIGSTNSTNFPGTAGSPIQSTFGGGTFDAFITKLNAAGTVIVYSTYLGGSGTELGFGGGIAVDAAGNAYVTGYTSSPNFPGTANSPLQSTLSGISDAFVAKITSSIPFAAFDARAKIDVDDQRHYGGGSHYRPHHNDAKGRDYQRHDDDDKFDLTATFTLGGGSNGIDLLKEAVMIQVGTFSTAIPPGSFKQHKGRYIFEGTINGVHLEAVFRSLILGNDYELKVEGHGADLTGTKNPVPVSITIGDDSGSKEITAKLK